MKYYSEEQVAELIDLATFRDTGKKLWLLEKVAQIKPIDQDDLKFSKAMNEIYEKTITDMTRILLEHGMLVVYDDQHNVIDIISESEVENAEIH